MGIEKKGTESHRRITQKSKTTIADSWKKKLLFLFSQEHISKKKKSFCCRKESADTINICIPYFKQNGIKQQNLLSSENMINF